MSPDPETDAEPGLIRTEIEPVWRFRREDDGRTTLVMLDFLNEIRATGKITRAAIRADMSYRHCWNLVEKWAAFFGAPLVERHQGRGTRLTPLGEKLVWAGQRLQARLKPQLQNLAQELETEINELLPQRTKVVRIHASHGFAVSKLRELLSSLEPQLGVDLRYVSNQNSLASLARGACDLAGVHLPLGELRGKLVAAARQWLIAGEHRVIGFVTREMGLMVKRGNPLHIESLEGLAGGVRFVNRDLDSGTRRLFDELLKQQGVVAARIDGYEHEEFTHAAVAAYVASGMADACFGVEAAARQFDLDFVRLLTEDYLFVCRKHTLENESVQRLVSVMRSHEFAAAIGELPGYAAKDPGVIKGIREALR
jgi:molybdate transport repressor ModE-like protein